MTARNYIDLLKFHLGRIAGYSFELDQLAFHSDAENDYFYNRLKSARFYLEYGAGASTVAAAKVGCQTITIESDRKIIQYVEAHLKQKNINNNISLIHRSVGFLGPYGSPFISIFFPLSSSRRNLFRNYSGPPGGTLSYRPDFILVDGRFRVSCALRLLYHFQIDGHQEYELIVDDYSSRPCYHVLEKFLKLKGKLGEFGIFTHNPSVDIYSLTEAIKQYELSAD